MTTVIPGPRGPSDKLARLAATVTITEQSPMCQELRHSSGSLFPLSTSRRGANSHVDRIRDGNRERYPTRETTSASYAWYDLISTRSPTRSSGLLRKRISYNRTRSLYVRPRHSRVLHPVRERRTERERERERRLSPLTRRILSFASRKSTKRKGAKETKSV